VTEPERLPIAPDPLLPDELEARVAALERADTREDFDSASWLWMLLFGLALPIALLIWGF
jgi:hypothetical protein